MPTFSSRVLTWFDAHGRKQLPWQTDPTAYRIWVSEIMLQQTQVQTVVPYFERFVHRFPTVQRLAGAPVDAVLHLWSGLGYYARARNLHRAAQQVCTQYAGVIPDDIDRLQSLPGIGRSTAGAILALVHNKRQPILDGNVKRVLARYYMVDGWPGRPQVMRTLWRYAQDNTPHRRIADYTQAMMDLGALVCKRVNPACPTCPLHNGCGACQTGRQTHYPARKTRDPLPVRKTCFVIVRDSGGAVLLQRRPAQGVWGGLWVFPEIESADIAQRWMIQTLGVKCRRIVALPEFRHTFTHFHLDIAPICCEIGRSASTVMDSGDRLWYKSDQAESIGFPAPVKRLLTALREVRGLNNDDAMQDSRPALSPR